MGDAVSSHCVYVYIYIYQVRNISGLNQTGSSRVGKKMPDSGYIGLGKKSV